MNDRQKALFILAILENENLQISAAVAKQMVQCQVWMQEIADKEASRADDAGFPLTNASEEL